MGYFKNQHTLLGFVCDFLSFSFFSVDLVGKVEGGCGVVMLTCII